MVILLKSPIGKVLNLAFLVEASFPNRPGKGVNIVGDDFMLTGADNAADPSAPDAFVEGIMEGKEWVWDGGILREQTGKEDLQKQINTLVTQGHFDEKKLDLFNNFLNNL